ncbi:MAG: IS1380 family transposase [Gemmatimonadetes bacterium]|nr:IS1380 family transposase [Gemmatimonadota bacterium]
MPTDCSPGQLEFQGFGGRRVEAAFDGGRQTSDAGLLLLREVAERTGLLRRFAGCFRDYRRPERIEHTVGELVSQRVLAQVQGYEDLNDHDTLRDDPLLALASGKRDLLGAERMRERDRGHALAGKSTLNRLERTPAEPTARYHKIVYDGEAVPFVFIDHFVASHPQPPARIVLDLDATDDPLHGQQEGRFFHGYYRRYCYLPLYVFCGEFLLWAELRPSNIDASAGSIEALEAIVGRIRARWPEVEIWIRADSGFAREAIMAWCEANGVQYVLGLARNKRLVRAIGGELEQVREEAQRTGEKARCFRDLRYCTKKSWSRERRVIAKAEQLGDKANPRFVVTSLDAASYSAPAVYERLYCARGDMENRIKEQQLGMFADRTSTATMRGNQLRLWIASLAYTLAQALRRLGLAGTALATAQVDTIRLRLLKLSGVVKTSVRRIRIALSSAFPLQDIYAQVLRNLEALPFPST